MAKAVFTHKEGSIYDDRQDERYHFPRTYLNVVERTVNDWFVYYEPRRLAAGSEKIGGRQAYTAVARITRIDRDPEREDHFYARIDPGSYLPFPTPPAFRMGERYLESRLQRPDGATSKGAFGRSVRELPEHEFDAILALGFAGLRPELGAADWASGSDGAREVGGFSEGPATFDHGPRRIVEHLTARPFREAAFARQVKEVYRGTCAMTGLRILNGGGRPEVQAAHIRPVADAGPDHVRNGLALCGTAHWMFDRGLVSVDDDLSILVARDHLPDAAVRLFNADRRLLAPADIALRPAPRFLDYHRRQVFKG